MGCRRNKTKYLISKGSLLSCQLSSAMKTMGFQEPHQLSNQVGYLIFFKGYFQLRFYFLYLKLSSAYSHDTKTFFFNLKVSQCSRKDRYMITKNIICLNNFCIRNRKCYENAQKEPLSWAFKNCQRLAFVQGWRRKNIVQVEEIM